MAPLVSLGRPPLIPAEDLGTLSGLATAVGYIGTIVGLLVVAPFFDGRFPFLSDLPAGFGPVTPDRASGP